MFKKITEMFKRNRNPTKDFKLMRILNDISFNKFEHKEKLLKTYSLIYSVVDRKSKAIAQLPLRLYKNDIIKDNKCVFKRKTVVDNDLSYILHIAPNKNMTPYLFWRTVIAQKEIYGNSYVYIKRNKAGVVVELNILDPSELSIYINKTNDEIYYKPYNDKDIYLHNLDILHFSSVHISGYKGISFIECLKNQLTLKNNIVKISSEQMDKSIKAGATLKLPTSLSIDKMKEYKEQFEKSYSQGFNGLVVLDAGMAFEQIKYDINDLKQSELNNITAKEVSSVSGLPLFMLGEPENKYVNMEHQTIDFVQNCISPEVVLIEQELNKKLLSEDQIMQGYYFKFNINALMRADMNTRSQFYREMVSMGAMTLNEIRSLEDLESYGEIGERPVISLNYSFLDTLDNHQRLNGGDSN